MRTRLFLGITLALVVGSLTAAVSVRPATAQTLPVVLTATMTGPQEVPGPGDPDGAGTATFILQPDQGRLCFILTAFAIEPATAAHIHRGGPDVAGPIVVPLAPPTHGVSGGCVDADPALLQAISANPEGYYANVHNAPYPAGAIRGQLRR